MELIEGVGESSSPPRSFGAGGAAVGVVGFDIKTDVYNRLIENGNEEALSNPEFRELLDAHFNRLPASYGLDVNIDRAEDVLLHRKLLALAKDPAKRPVFHVRCLEGTLGACIQLLGISWVASNPIRNHLLTWEVILGRKVKEGSHGLTLQLL